MALSYIGGKFAKTEFLYSHCPEKIHYKTLVLNFSGVGWLFLKQDFSHCEKVVFNDINPYLINMLKAFTESERFLEEFGYYMEEGKELYLNPEETLQEARLRFFNLYKNWNEELFKKIINLDEVDYTAAVQFAFLISHSFSARHPKRAGFNFKSEKTTHPNFMRIINKLKKNEYGDLLKKVKFESLDFEQCFKKYDARDTFFYTDPPYWLCESDYDVDNDKFGLYGHIRLSRAMQQMEGRIMLSYYNFPYLDSFYPSRTFARAQESFHKPSCNFKAVKERGQEVIVMNYNSEGRLHCWDRESSEPIETYLEIAGLEAPPMHIRRTRKSYSTNFKRIIVDLIEMGVKKAELMRRFKIGSYATLKRWQMKYSTPDEGLRLAA